MNKLKRKQLQFISNLMFYRALPVINTVVRDNRLKQNVRLLSSISSEGRDLDWLQSGIRCYIETQVCC